MDPFHLCVACGPLAVYLSIIAAINLIRRPFVVSAVRDAGALGLAVSGLVVIGPAELFFPSAAAIHFGAYVWLLLIALYALCLILILLLLRPRIIVYNIPAEELRAILADLAPRLDQKSRWAGDSLAMPQLGVQLHLEASTVMRNISLVAAGPRQNHAGWRRLETALIEGTREFEVSRNYRALGLLTFAGMLLAVMTLAVYNNPQLIARSLLEVLRL